MNKREMEKFKKLLTEKRDDLTKIVQKAKKEDLTENEIGDEIDSAFQNAEKELLFGIADNEKVIIDAIESALRRIEKSTYGKCESCGDKIKDARLKAIPWVRYCIKCQSESEKPSK
ncbi:TraR/DksA family transcriptional regulator [Elusimicrobiota bacterium]